MARRLEGKTALITGGTTGIGLATAKLFAEEGAKVTVTGTNPATIESARSELRGRAEVVASDASDPAQIRDLVAEVTRRDGGIDVLFLNAGVAQFGPIDDFDVTGFDRMWRINVRGPWLAIQAAAPHLRDGGSVILNTSVAGVKGLPGASAYSATKAALRSIARTASADLLSRGIRVNAVSPGPIDTPLSGKLGIPPEAAEAFVKSLGSSTPMQRVGTADEVAKAALFLASADSSYVAGAELTVDGGFANI